MSAQWSGPLPPPGALAQFNDIIPDGAERIMAMVEREQAHRIAHETKELDAATRDFSRGHWMGAVIALSCVAAATYTAFIGTHWSVSVALVGLPITALAGKLFSRK
ncbi:MAG: putative membrane protein [Rhodoferax sp.]|jgi:uncharacterized membrane protein